MCSMMLFVYLLGLITSLARSNAQDPNQRLPTAVEEQYKHIFNFKLPQVFGAPESLNEAARQTQINGALPMYSDKSLGYGCASYEVGTEIAKNCRENGMKDLVPILVDEEHDIMCFMTIRTTNSEPEHWHQLRWVNFPSPLKLHDSIYDTIHNKTLDSSLQTMEVSFRQEAFFAEPDHYDSEIDNYFRTNFSTIFEYNNLVVNNYFWSSSDSQEFYDAASEMRTNPALMGDRNRYYEWSDALQSVLQERERQLENRVYGYESTDVCMFDDLYELAEYQPSVYRFKIQDWLGDVTEDFKVPCLAFLIAGLSLLPSVHNVVLVKGPELFNFRARSIPQTARVGYDASFEPFTAAGLLGDGQIIGIADTGVDAFSCYFYDAQGRVSPSPITAPVSDMKYRKIVQYLYNGCGDTTDTTGGHGTHVAGIATGNMANANIYSEGRYDGVAPNAKLSFADLSKGGSGLCIPPVSQLYSPAFNLGARIFSNSWGTYFSGAGYYSGQDIDTFLYKTASVAIFFAAGNAGGNGHGDRTVTVESSPKNTISVGSSETTLGSTDISYVAFYSSKGPTYDNRFKPDIVSPGDSLESANAAGSQSTTCSTIQMTGTSMATPGAAANGLLIRQYFMDPNSKFWRAVCNTAYRSCKSFTPSGTLIKAIVIHSGSRMTKFDGGGDYDVNLGAPPDFIQGFGRISLFRALPLKGSISYDLFVADAVNIQENTQVSYNLQIVNSSIPLRITLAWYDPPNVQGATSKALLNNLDLLVTSPSNIIFYPNGRSSPDTTNNNERVNVSSPQTGNWRVSVIAKALPVMGNQLFSLAITSGGKVSYA